MDKIVSIRLKISDINKCSYIAQKLKDWDKNNDDYTMTDVIKLCIRLTTTFVQDMDEAETITDDDIYALKKSLTNST